MSRKINRSEWPNLPTVSSSFAEKADEINRHLELLSKMLQRDTVLEYQEPSPILPHKHRTRRIGIMPEDTHPLKAGAVLMIYNFMESVSTDLMQDIYNHLKEDTLQSPKRSLSQLNKNFRDTILNYANNNMLKSSVGLYINGSLKFDEALLSEWFKHLIDDKKVSIEKGVDYYKWFNGNVDVLQLRKTLEKYQMFCERCVTFKDIKTRTELSRPSSLMSTKQARNLLAHGGVTFSDFGKNKSFEEIQKDFTNILGFFDGLLDLVNDNLTRKRYLQN